MKLAVLISALLSFSAVAGLQTKDTDIQVHTFSYHMNHPVNQIDQILLQEESKMHQEMETTVQQELEMIQITPISYESDGTSDKMLSPN